MIGFSLLGIGASSIVPISYSLAGKIEGIDSGVASDFNPKKHLESLKAKALKND